MTHYHASQATDRTPCPISHVDARYPLLKLGLIVGGTIIGTFGATAIAFAKLFQWAEEQYRNRL